MNKPNLNVYQRAAARESLAGEIALGLAVLKTSTAELARWRKRFARRLAGEPLPPIRQARPIAPTVFTWHARTSGTWQPLYMN